MDPRPSDGFQPEWVAGFQRNYLKRLESALRHIRARRRSQGMASRRRAVKFAADLTLAMTARGTAWSRGILAQSRKDSPNFIDFIRSCGRRRIFCNKMKAVSGRHPGRGAGRWKASDQWRTNFHRIRRNLHSIRRASSKTFRTGVKPAKLNAASKKSARRLLVAAKRRSEIRNVDARIQTLKSLLPGGRSMDTPVLLQEAADYIVALKMQVETMQILANYLTNSATADSRP